MICTFQKQKRNIAQLKITATIECKAINHVLREKVFMDPASIDRRVLPLSPLLQTTLSERCMPLLLSVVCEMPRNDNAVQIVEHLMLF